MACVYVLQHGEDNLFKIGRAADLDKRMKALATGNPHPLTAYAVIETEHPAACEAFMHHLVQSRRSTRSDAKEFFDLEPTELDELVRDAQAFIKEYLPMKEEVERLAELPSDDSMLEPATEHGEIYERLLQARQERDKLNYECERLEAKLKLAIRTAAGIEGIATWKAHSTKRFDQEAFGNEYPDLHDAFMRESLSRVFKLL
jgi:Meiotically Up-regulated Gene 113 (MUG113) protein